MIFCFHRKTTWPRTPVDKHGRPNGPTYVACLNCGAELQYDWETKKRGEQIVSHAVPSKPKEQYA